VSSYIPTKAASVARAADVIKLAGTASSTMLGAAGSVVVEASPIKGVVGTAAFLGLNTVAPFTQIYSKTATSYAFFKTADATLATIGGAGNMTANNTRFAFGWSAAGNSLVANAGTLVTNATTLSGVAATQYLGSYNANAGVINGYIRGVSFYNQRLADASLQSKSTVGGAL
jgi:hypothetical protein